ncbi:MAG: hypothetical protein WCG42_01190 [Parachlamydiaceae bacterium]
MNKKTRMYVLIFTILVCGTYFMSNRHTPSKYVIMAHQIRTDVAEKLSKRYNMRVIGVRGGMAGSVNVIGLSFQILGPLSKEKLREILVDCVEEFLASINANEQIRPFLKNYPFTEKEIDITIFVVDASGRNVYDPDVLVATAFIGKIWYNTEDKDNEFKYKQEMEEDYQTALKIVRETKQK